MVSIPAKTQNKLERRNSEESRKIWNLEQKNQPVIEVGDITKIDSRIVNDYQNGQQLVMRDNTGTLYNVVVSDGKLLKANSTFTEI